MDGPDGVSMFWQDQRVAGRWRSTRQKGRVGLMIWGCFSENGKPDLVFVEESMDSST